MVPNVHFLGLDLYDWAILCGIVAAMILFRALYKRMGLTYPVFVLSLTVSVFAIVGGYCSAALFQSFYVFLESGTFAWGVGTTFYGGLIGASLIFLALYFGAGHFFCKGAHIRQFNRMLALVAPCIALAHAFGRIGCLLGGCCYGAETESFFGLPMLINGQWQKRIPLQLFESIFLFLLCGALVFLLLKRRGTYNASVYLIAYGVWRFTVEFFRADDRGASGISFLTPSQLTAIVLVALGIGYIFLYRFVLKKYLCGENGNEPA